MNELAYHEKIILRFEQAWMEGKRPSIRDFLREDIDRTLLAELICVDLEYQWKEVADGRYRKAMTLSEYVEEFAELGPMEDLPTELVEEEYRARTVWGDRPLHELIIERFPSRRTEILQSLNRIDSEIRRELDDTGNRRASIEPVKRRIQVETDPRAPLLYGDYLLLEMVGAGRMGRVYRAKQKRENRHVAVKFLRKHFLQHPSAVEQFIREANIVSQLSHPGVVRIHGLGTTPGAGYFIAMDLVEGMDLATKITSGPISVKNAVQWILQACDALQHAHELGIIHCDLKPANLLLDEDDRVHVTDFGLARSASGEQPIDRIEGTAAYMAPEQVSGWWGTVGVRADVYGIGAILYQLLTGVPPFHGATLTDILSRVVSGARVASPERLRPELPEPLTTICLRCLNKKQSERFDTLRDVQNALTENGIT